MSTEKRNILLICPQFHDYQRMIADELKKRYDGVYVISEYPLGAPIRYFTAVKIPGLKKILWQRYVDNVINLTKKIKLNKILIIRGNLLPEVLLKCLAEISDCELIQYQWDSIKNNPNALNISRYALRNYTFDRNDADFHTNFYYLPLFYYWDEISLTSKLKKQIDILYLGSWSYERLRLINEISSICDQNGIKICIHLVMSKGEFLQRIFKVSPKLYKYIRFKAVERYEYYRMMRQCVAVFDVPSRQQVGSSMRTIEAISLSKKVITTNMNVISEDFYNEQNFLLWPTQKEYINVFLSTPFNRNSLNKVYSLEQWINQMGL